MSERDDYADNDHPPPWWRRRPDVALALALLVAVILVATAIFVFGPPILSALLSDPEYRR